MTKETRIERLDSEPIVDVLALLEGRLFHVTSPSNYESIRRDGQIRPNTTGEFIGAFGLRRNGFFQKRGFISLFDYRTKPPADPVDYRWRCDPFAPGKVEGGVAAMLLLNDCIGTDLVSWERWKHEDARGDMVVPYVEAGHPGPISFGLVTEVLLVTLRPDPASIAAQLGYTTMDERKSPRET